MSSVDVTALSISVTSTGIKEASNALGGLSTSALNATKRVNDLITAMQRLNTVSPATNALAGSTAALTAALNALNTTLGQLNQRTTQTTQSQRQHNESMREAHGLARGLAGSMGALWLTYGNFAGMAVGVGIGATLKGILEVGMEVEKQLNFVFALSANREVVDLGSFIKITESSVQSITDAANAMRALAQNGLSVGASLTALPAILNLATVGEMDVGQAAIAATGAVSAFGLSISEVERVTDIFAKTAATSNTSVLAMTESMKQASTAASLFKVSIEETAAMLGLLAKINITGGAAGTSLTNMLTGLYEPTEQAKKAMQRLGVTAFEQNGKLKNMTVLLEDIKRASSNLSEETKADIFGDMVTTRGMKSLTLALDNLDVLKSKTKDNAEAMGFMKGVVEKLEDSSSAAFKRMSVIIESEFTQAFANAAPEVQALGIALGDLFKSDAPMRMNSITGKMEKETTAIANLVKNLAIAANFLVEHIGIISSLVAGYVLWRAAIGYTVVAQTALGTSTATVGGLYTAWRTSVIAAAAAQALASTSMAALTTANIAGAATNAMVTATVEANTAATIANTTAKRAMMAFILPALGVLAAAIAAGAALWLLFRDNVSDAADANTKMTNTIHVIEEQLSREEERLKRVIGLWNDRKKAFNESTSVAPETKAAAVGLEAKLKGQIEGLLGRAMKQGDIDNIMSTGPQTAKARALGELATQYLKASSNLATLQEQEKRSGVVSQNKVYEKSINDLASFREQVEKFYNEGSAVGSKGTKGTKDFLVTNSVERELRINQGKKILDQIDAINSKEIAGPGLKAAQQQVERLKVDFKKLNDQVSDTKKPNILPPERATVNDAMNRELASAQAKTELAKRTMNQAKEAAESVFKQGKIGEITLIERNKQAELSYNDTIIKVSNDKIAILRKNKNQTSAIQQELTNIRLAEQNKEFAKQDAENKLSEESVRLVQEAQKARAAAYLSNGQFVAAFEEEQGRKHDIRTNQILDNLGRETDTVRFNALQQLLIAEAKEKAAGLQVASNKEISASFDLLAASTKNSSKGIQTANEGQGLVAMWEAAIAAQATYSANLPKMQAQMDLLKVSDPKAYEEKQALLLNQAETMRKTWVGVGESISKSLENAFGRGGKAAADLFKIGAAFARQEDKSGTARIKAFGDAAGAAKGFFKEGTTGYKIMEGAEKAFRAVELAGMIMSVATTGSTEAAKNAMKTPGALLSFMSSMPAWAWAGAGLAVAAVLSGGGGAGPSRSEERQKTQGTGSVLGSDEKSNSLANSLEIMERNSGLGLAQGNQMVGYLKVVANNLEAMASLIVRTTSMSGAAASKQFTGTDNMNGFQKLGSKIFGGAKTVADSGFTLDRTTLGSAAAGGVSASQFTDVKKDGGWFRKDKISTEMKSLGEDVNAQFSKTISSMAEALKQSSTYLGIGGDAFNQRLSSFVIDVGMISLKGMSGAEVQEALQGVFSKLGDDMAKFAIQGLDKFQQVGEGYLETVMRITNNLMQVRDVFTVLDKTFALTGIAAINVSESLIAAAGGIEKLTEGTKFFVDNFLTEAEKMEPITNSVAKRLKELGVSELTTIELYKKKIRALDLTSAADQKLYAELLVLAPAFKQVADYAEELAEGVVKLTKAQQKALDAVNAARSNLEKAYNAERDALQSTIDKTKTYLQTLKDFQNSLKLGANSPLTNVEKYAEAKRQFEAIFEAAKGGDTVAQQKFTGIASEFLNASKLVNASSIAYTSDFAKVLSATGSLGDEAVKQIDVAMESLNALNKQVEGLIKLNEGVMSVTQAVTELRLAIEAGRLAGLTNAAMGIPGATAVAATPQEALLVGAIQKLTAEVTELKVQSSAQTGEVVKAVYEAADQNAVDTVDGFTKAGGRSTTTVNLV